MEKDKGNLETKGILWGFGGTSRERKEGTEQASVMLCDSIPLWAYSSIWNRTRVS